MISLIAPPDDDTPMALLLACHQRIRKFLKIAWKLGEVTTEDHDTIKNSARDAARYFSEALPLHMDDERDSIMPRLIGDSSRMDAALARMHREHLDEEAAVLKLVGYCNVLSNNPADLDSIRDDLRQCVRELTVKLESHLSGEEREIFPALADLSADVQQTIVAEMRARRSRSTHG